MIKRHHLRYHQTVAGEASEPALPTSLHPARPTPVHPVNMSSPQEAFLNFSQGQSLTVAAPRNRDGHSSLLIDNYIMDAFLPDLDFQSAPDEERTGSFSGQI